MKANTLFSYSIIGIILMIAGQLCFAINDTIVKFEVQNIENNYVIFNIIFIRGLFSTFFIYTLPKIAQPWSLSFFIETLIGFLNF